MDFYSLGLPKLNGLPSNEFLPEPLIASSTPTRYLESVGNQSKCFLISAGMLFSIETSLNLMVGGIPGNRDGRRIVLPAVVQLKPERDCTK
jgi:hypothetical protein